MNTLTTITTKPLILLAIALGMAGMYPASAHGDDRKKDESADPKDDKRDEKSDPLPPIVCEDDKDKKGNESGTPEEAPRRRPPTAYDNGRCVDPTPTE
jgi:hypothetical protein